MLQLLVLLVVVVVEVVVVVVVVVVVLCQALQHQGGRLPAAGLRAPRLRGASPGERKAN